MKILSIKSSQGEKGKLVALTFLIVCAFVFGGGARYDIVSLIILRPISVFITAYAMFAYISEKGSQSSTPLLCLVALFAWAIIQTIPLPPQIWQSLPGREIIVSIDAARGEPNIWRPLSLSPSRTINAIFSMFVPLAVLLLVSIISKKDVDKLILIVIALIFFSIILGVAQVIGPVNGPLYFYKVTNQGLPVGLFANRNHHGIFLASALPIVMYFIIFKLNSKLNNLQQVFLTVFAVFSIITMTFLTGSRSGSVLASFTFLVIMVFATRRFRSNSSRQLAPNREKTISILHRFSVPIAAVTIFVIVGLALDFSGSSAVTRFSENDIDSEVRFKTLPYVTSLAWEYLPIGSGFGSFEFVYKIIEPDALLTPNYFNQAHNDLLQIVVEGGVPAGTILMVFLFWLSKRVVAAAKEVWYLNHGDSNAEHSWRLGAALLAIIVVLIGSIADYPVRTPLVMSYVALLTGVATRWNHR